MNSIVSVFMNTDYLLRCDLAGVGGKQRRPHIEAHKVISHNATAAAYRPSTARLCKATSEERSSSSHHGFVTSDWKCIMEQRAG